MAKVGAQRAAELTGKSKSTIQRAMKSGKISYEMDHNERRVVDVAELERAFGLIPQESDKKGQEAVQAELEKATQMLEMERLKMRIKVLEEQLDVAKDQIEDLKEQRDQWQKQAQQVLITSEYSQKQAQEMREQMQERERRVRMRRQQMMDQRTHKAKARNSSASSDNSKSFDIQGFWNKIRTKNDNVSESTKATDAVEGNKPSSDKDADKAAA